MTENLGDPEPDQDASEDVPVLRMGPDGEIVEEKDDPSETARDLTDLVEQPAKVMRIGSMVKQLLEEVKDAPLDEASRAQLGKIHERSVAELKDGLAPELVDELERLSLPFDNETEPSEAELRIAQAQLVGWLEGLFHGIQTAIFAQQMTAKAAFEEMRQRAIGGGNPGGPEGSENADHDPRHPTGPYL
jgi:hypothetical protein